MNAPVAKCQRAACTSHSQTNPMCAVSVQPMRAWRNITKASVAIPDRGPSRAHAVQHQSLGGTQFDVSSELLGCEHGRDMDPSPKRAPNPSALPRAAPKAPRKSACRRNSAGRNLNRRNVRLMICCAVKLPGGRRGMPLRFKARLRCTPGVLKPWRRKSRHRFCVHGLLMPLMLGAAAAITLAMHNSPHPCARLSSPADAVAKTLRDTRFEIHAQTCENMRKHAHTFAQVRTRAHTCAHVQTHAHTCARVGTCARAHMRKSAHAHRGTNAQMHK